MKYIKIVDIFKEDLYQIPILILKVLFKYFSIQNKFYY